jgi:hypothetical protein
MVWLAPYGNPTLPLHVQSATARLPHFLHALHGATANSASQIQGGGSVSGSLLGMGSYNLGSLDLTGYIPRVERLDATPLYW